MPYVPPSPTLVLRADATSQLGLGHVMRCLALAQAWKARGGRAVMISHCPFDCVRKAIRQQGIQLVPLSAPHPAADDVSTTLLTLSDLAGNARPGQSQNWGVVDGGHFDPSYLTLLRSTGSLVALIDDHGKPARLDVDLLINQNFGAELLAYRLPHGSRQLLGLRHALLRNDFLAWRGLRRPVPAVAGKLLITLGGSDPANATAAVIRAVSQIRGPEFEARVVVGPANSHLRALRCQAIESRVPMRLVTDSQAMPSLMGWADLAISAAGVTCWELACIGVPNATLATSPAQLPIIDAVARLGAVVPLGLASDIDPHALASQITDLLTDQDKRQTLVQNGQTLVDGRGADRVACAMLSAAGQQILPLTDDNQETSQEHYHEAA